MAGQTLRGSITPLSGAWVVSQTQEIVRANMIMLADQRDLFGGGRLLAAFHLADRGPASADDMT